MHVRFKARCERVRPNNGITEVLFTHHADISDIKLQDKIVLLNDMLDEMPEVDKDYWIEIQPVK